MLFSRPDVAEFITRYFEPAWESVRTVPLIRIDFGNGTVVTRTLHGNIATYVCNANGQVLDVLPAIYGPNVYMDRLNQLRLLANYVAQLGKGAPETRLKEYHQRLAAALVKNERAPVLVRSAGITKRVIESPVKLMLVTGNPAARQPAEETPNLASREDVAGWKQLAEDTRQNETLRRRLIHEMLAAQGMVKPEAITKRLYKEVLHADLDDPYLGLKELLYASYPFEDGAH